MPEGGHMDTTHEIVIEQIVQSIYATMLNIELVRIDEPASLDLDSLLATVQISGQWMGCVVLAMSPNVARASAAAMLHISEQETTDIDQKDVAAELVNMTGGNLKSLLPGPSFLSLPTVVTGQDINMRIRDAELIDDVTLACEVGPIRVRLYVEIPRERD